MTLVKARSGAPSTCADAVPAGPVTVLVLTFGYHKFVATWRRLGTAWEDPTHSGALQPSEMILEPVMAELVDRARLT